MRTCLKEKTLTKKTNVKASCTNIPIKVALLTILPYLSLIYQTKTNTIFTEKPVFYFRKKHPVFLNSHVQHIITKDRQLQKSTFCFH